MSVEQYKNLPRDTRRVVEKLLSRSADFYTESETGRNHYEQFLKAVRGEIGPDLGWTKEDWAAAPKAIRNFADIVENHRLILQAGVVSSFGWSEEETEAVKLLTSNVPRHFPPVDEDFKSDMEAVKKGLRNGEITRDVFITSLASYNVKHQDGTVTCFPHGHDCDVEFPREGRDYFVLEYGEEEQVRRGLVQTLGNLESQSYN